MPSPVTIVDKDLPHVALEINSDGSINTTPQSGSTGDVNLTKIGGTAVDANSGNKSAGTLRVVLATDQPALSNAQPASINATTIDDYETVAASQTAQVLGATGASGDFLSGVLVVPATVSPGNVIILDNATSITVFAGGTNSVSSLVPFFIPIGAASVSGAWKVTTGANVSCIGIGKFT